MHLIQFCCAQTTLKSRNILTGATLDAIFGRHPRFTLICLLMMRLVTTTV